MNTMVAQHANTSGVKNFKHIISVLWLLKKNRANTDSKNSSDKRVGDVHYIMRATLIYG